MNVRITKIIWLLAFVASVAVYFDFRDDARVTATSPGTPVFTPFTLDTISAIHIERTNTVLRIQSSPEGWTLSNGDSQSKANDTIIRHFVEDLIALKHLSHIDTPQGSGPAANYLQTYGLSPAETVIHIEFQNHTNSLQIGASTLIGNQFYVLNASTSKISTVDGNLLSRLPKGPNDWRSKKLLTLEGLNLDEIRFESLEGSVVMARDKEKDAWQIAQPEPVRRASKPMIMSLLAGLDQLAIVDFVEATDESSLSNYGLRPPRMKLVLADADGSVASLGFGNLTTNNPSLMYLERAQFGDVVLVPSGLFDALQNPSFRFRSRQILSVTPKDVSRIEVTSASSGFSLQRTNETQWVVNQENRFKADPALVNEFVNVLASLQSVEFHQDVVTDYRQYQLSPPESVYQLFNSEDQPIATLLIGTNMVDKTLVRTEQEPYVYAIAEGDRARLPKTAFELRDRQIFSIDPLRVGALQVNSKAGERVIQRNEKGLWDLEGNAERIQEISVEAAALESAVQELATLRAENWVAVGEKALTQFGFDDRSPRISLLLREAAPDEPSPSITFSGKISALYRPYASTTFEGVPYVFEFPTRVFTPLYQALKLEFPISSKNSNAKTSNQD